MITITIDVASAFLGFAAGMIFAFFIFWMLN